MMDQKTQFRNEEDNLQMLKSQLLVERDKLINMKLNLQKEVWFPPPQDFCRKYGSKSGTVPVAEKLNHRLSDARLLSSLECYMLCGMRILNYNSKHLLVQFRPSYKEAIFTDTYAVKLSAGNDGIYEVSKYHLPHSINLKCLFAQWTPLKKESLRTFLMEIKLQINAFYHRKNQIQELKQWASEKNVDLKIFHPLSLTCLIITLKCNDVKRLGTFTMLDLILQYESNGYLPATLEIESREVGEADLAMAKKQFSAFKLYSLREAFQICCMKEERLSLPLRDSAVDDAADSEVAQEDSETHTDEVMNDAPLSREKNSILNSKRKFISHNKKNRVTKLNDEKNKTKNASNKEKDENLMSEKSTVSKKTDLKRKPAVGKKSALKRKSAVGEKGTLSKTSNVKTKQLTLNTYVQKVKRTKK